MGGGGRGDLRKQYFASEREKKNLAELRFDLKLVEKFLQYLNKSKKYYIATR